jgi:hypothetical protein
MEDAPLAESLIFIGTNSPLLKFDPARFDILEGMQAIARSSQSPRA